MRHFDVKRGGGRRRNGLSAWLDLLPAAHAPFSDPQGSKGFWRVLTRAPRHRVTAYRVPLRGVGTRPWRVALLADLHCGAHAGDPERLGVIVADTNALAPDVVLLLGDYVNMIGFAGGRVPPGTIAGILSGIAAPAYAVLGNHDWEYGYDAVAGALEAAGIAVIDNRIVSVARDGERLTLVGFEDERWGRPDLTLLDRVPSGDPVILATHDPGLFHDAPPGSVMVAGHMHGGQFRCPGLPALVVPSGRAPRRWAHGLVAERARTLIVSAGLGPSGLPWRIGIAPEIVLVEFTSP